jgi:hypothetical protein
MTCRNLALWVTCLSIVSTFGGPGWTQQPELPTDQAKSKKMAWLHAAYLRDASEYKFFLDEGRRQELELRREPVMRWTSDADYNGEVYVWTHQGVAAIVGCIFSGPQGKSARQVMHEFHSLAPNHLYAGEQGGSRWLPQEPGIKLEPVPDGPEPATSPARRLMQMRDLSRHFTAQVQREGSKWEMRLLPQPIYRYEVSDDKSPIIDGAVFSFLWTAGTDPEVLLVLEARRTGKGLRWYYAPARFTNCEAWLQYRDKEIWRADPATVGIFDGVTSKRYGAFQVKTITYPPDQ